MQIDEAIDRTKELLTKNQQNLKLAQEMDPINNELIANLEFLNAETEGLMKNLERAKEVVTKIAETLEAADQKSREIIGTQYPGQEN